MILVKWIMFLQDLFDAIVYENWQESLFLQEKKEVKEEKLKLEEKYMWAIVDGVKEKVSSLLSTEVIVVVSLYA